MRLKRAGFVYDFNVGATLSDYYTYDANGNIKTDRHKEITDIVYNYLNLPMVITFSNSRVISFVYDASGAKLRKITNNNGTVDTYDYVNGVEYKNNILQRIAHTEGSVSRQDNGTYLHEYVLRDHLGNTRVTFSDANNDGTIVSADIKQINSYYPFGLNMDGNFNGAAGKNKYAYNGKEWNDDFSLGWNDYGARFYDPAIARWSVIDPLSEKMRRHSPYNYAFDNPMRFVDPDGMEPQDGGKKGKQQQSSPPTNPVIGTLSIKTNVSKDANMIDGHGWLEFKFKDGKVTTFSLWGNQGGREFFQDKEVGMKSATSRTVNITKKDLDKFVEYNKNAGNVDWTCTNTCAGYSARAWNVTTGENLSASNIAGITTPAKLAESIYSANGNQNNNTPQQPNQTGDNSSANSGSSTSSSAASSSTSSSSSYGGSSGEGTSFESSSVGSSGQAPPQKSSTSGGSNN